MSTDKKTDEDQQQQVQQSSKTQELLKKVGAGAAIFCFGGQVAYVLGTGILLAVVESILGPELTDKAEYFFIPESLGPVRSFIGGIQFAIRTAVLASFVVFSGGMLLIVGGITYAIGIGFFVFSSPKSLSLLVKNRFDISIPYAVGAASGWALYHNWRLVPLFGDGYWFNAAENPFIVLTAIAAITGIFAGVAGVNAGKANAKANDEKRAKIAEENNELTAARLLASSSEPLNTTSLGLRNLNDNKSSVFNNKKRRTDEDAEGKPKTEEEFKADLEKFEKKEEAEIRDFITQRGYAKGTAVIGSRFFAGVFVGFMCGAGRAFFDFIAAPYIASFMDSDDGVANFWRHGIRQSKNSAKTNTTN